MPFRSSSQVLRGMSELTLNAGNAMLGISGVESLKRLYVNGSISIETLESRLPEAIRNEWRTNERR